MSLVSRLKTQAKAVLAAVKLTLSGLAGQIAAFLTEGAAALAQSLSAQLPGLTAAQWALIRSAATDAVAAAALIPAGGQTKMATALALFAAGIGKQELKLAESQARLILENAVAIFKANQKAAGA